MKISQIASSLLLSAVVFAGIAVVTPTDSFALGARNHLKVHSQKGTHLGTVYVNLYETSPLTAVITRAGKDIEDIHVRVIGKPNKGIDIEYDVSRGSLLNHDGVPVFGLYADYTNQVEVSYTYKGKKFKDKYNVQTAPIVGVVKDGRNGNMLTRKVKKVAKGFENRLYLLNNTITSNHQPLNWMDGSGAAAWNDYTENFVVDTNGDIRWYMDYKHFYDRSERNVEKGGMAMGFHQLDDGDLIWTQAQKYFRYDMMGKKVFERKLPFGYIDASHEIQMMPNGHMLLRVGKAKYALPNGHYTHTIRDHIIEMDGSGKVVEEWDMAEILGKNQLRKDLLMALDARAVCLNIDMNAKHIEVNDKVPFGDYPSTGVGHNWAHINSIQYDKQDDSLILSFRHQGIVKVGRDKKVKWILASPKGWSKDLKAKVLKPIDAKGNKVICIDDVACPGYTDQSKSGFDYSWTQHTAWLSNRYDDNMGTTKTLSVFDNGDGRGMEQPAFKGDKYSRAVEYRIDEKNMTVQQTWEFGKQRGFDWFSVVTSNVLWHPETKTYAVTSANVHLISPMKTKAVVMDIDPKTNEVKVEMDVVSLSKDDVTYRSLVIDKDKLFNY
ncbi:MAG: arylsulfate sulfotransferase [Sulfurimonas sp.]|jgi:arylsulfate sulfotransferase